MFRIKLLSFSTKDSSGSLFDLSWSAGKLANAISNHTIGFKMERGSKPKPKPKKRFWLSLVDMVFKEEEE